MVYLYVGMGGFIGAVLRYLVGLFLMGPVTGFPYATLFANLTGSFLLPVLTIGFLEKHDISSEWKSAIGTGLVGSYTTFSTLTTDALALYGTGASILSITYIIISLAGGLLLSKFGFELGRRRVAS
ncbi:CrcB family protein [Halobacillus sp. KGW1]|uniref:fluoride efflux transporter FluC n=1 Tax=Halobacillus sp. KGW1 TaxID=1793726 RepID=UPI0007842D87|nr:CrcB family protein [Halobacillus sp. KGW1]